MRISIYEVFVSATEVPSLESLGFIWKESPQNRMFYHHVPYCDGTSGVYPMFTHTQIYFSSHSRMPQSHLTKKNVQRPRGIRLHQPVVNLDVPMGFHRLHGDIWRHAKHLSAPRAQVQQLQAKGQLCRSAIDLMAGNGYSLGRFEDLLESEV